MHNNNVLTFKEIKNLVTKYFEEESILLCHIGEVTDLRLNAAASISKLNGYSKEFILFSSIEYDYLKDFESKLDFETHRSYKKDSASFVVTNDYIKNIHKDNIIEDLFNSMNQRFRFNSRNNITMKDLAKYITLYVKAINEINKLYAYIDKTKRDQLTNWEFYINSILTDRSLGTTEPLYVK